MTDEGTDLQVHMMGRIVALELMMRGTMTQFAMENSSDPAKFVSDWKRDMLSHLQMLQRPIDEKSDAIWAEASDALNELFDQVEQRVANLQSGT